MSYITEATHIACKCDNCEHDQKIGDPLWVDDESWRLCPGCWIKFYAYWPDGHPGIIRDDEGCIVKNQITFYSHGDGDNQEWIKLKPHPNRHIAELDAVLSAQLRDLKDQLYRCYSEVKHMGVVTQRIIHRKARRETVDSAVGVYREYIGRVDANIGVMYCGLAKNMIRHILKQLYDDSRMCGRIPINIDGPNIPEKRVFVAMEYIKGKHWDVLDLIDCLEVQAVQRGRWIHG